VNVRWRAARLVVGLAVVVVYGAAAGRDGAIEWGEQGLVSARGLGRAGPAVAESAQPVNARRAAIVDAQRRLLEIIEGVTLYGGVSTGDAMASSDVVRASVRGVLQGATVLRGSEAWDPEHGVYELMMVVPVGDVQRSLPRLRLAADGSTILIVEQPAVSDRPEAPGPSRPATSFAANDDHVPVDRCGSVTVDALRNDVGDTSTFFLQVVAGVRYGTLLAGGGGRFTYSHACGHEPLDVFTYVLADGAGQTSLATVEISIAPVPPDPAEEKEVDPAEANTVAAAEDETVPPLDEEDLPPVDVDAPAPAEPDDAPVPAEPDDAPAPAEPDDAPAPAEPDDAPVPAEPDDAPVPAEPDDTPVPAEPDDAPAPAEVVSAPAGPGEDVAPEPAAEPPPPPPAPPVGVGGPAHPISGDLPTLIVLDASGHAIDRPFALDISSTSGELIYELAIPNYAPTLDIARRQGAEVLTISAVGPDLVSVVLDEGQATRLRTLIAQRDYVASGDLWIAGGN
jgi:hypothetical protein